MSTKQSELYVKPSAKEIWQAVEDWMDERTPHDPGEIILAKIWLRKRCKDIKICPECDGKCGEPCALSAEQHWANLCATKGKPSRASTALMEREGQAQRKIAELEKALRASSRLLERVLVHVPYNAIDVKMAQFHPVRACKTVDHIEAQLILNSAAMGDICLDPFSSSNPNNAPHLDK